jgi:hypothetical protein
MKIHNPGYLSITTEGIGSKMGGISSMIGGEKYVEEFSCKT